MTTSAEFLFIVFTVIWRHRRRILDQRYDKIWFWLIKIEDVVRCIYCVWLRRIQLSLDDLVNNTLVQLLERSFKLLVTLRDFEYGMELELSAKNGAACTRNYTFFQTTLISNFIKKCSFEFKKAYDFVTRSPSSRHFLCLTRLPVEQCRCGRDRCQF